MKTVLISIFILPITLFAYPDKVETILGKKGSAFICKTSATGNVLYKRKGCEKNEIDFDAASKQVANKQRKLNKKVNRFKDKVSNSTGQAKDKAQAKLNNNKRKAKDNKIIGKQIKKCQNGSLPPSFPAENANGFGSIMAKDEFDISFPVATIHNFGQHISYYSIIDPPGTDLDQQQGFVDLWGSKNKISDEVSQGGLNLEYKTRGCFQAPGSSEVVKVNGVMVVNYIPLPQIFFEFVSNDINTFSLDFLPTPTESTLGDLDGDNNVDFQDVNIFNRCFKGPNIAFPSSNPNCPGLDINNDGFIDFTDASTIFTDGFESGNVSAWSNTR